MSWSKHQPYHPAFIIPLNKTERTGPIEWMKDALAY